MKSKSIEEFQNGRGHCVLLAFYDVQQTIQSMRRCRNFPFEE